MWATGTKVVCITPLQMGSVRHIPAGTTGTVYVKAVPKRLAEHAAMRDSFAVWVQPDSPTSPPGWSLGKYWRKLSGDGEEKGSWEQIQKDTGWIPPKLKESPHA